MEQTHTENMQAAPAPRTTMEGFREAAGELARELDGFALDRRRRITDGCRHALEDARGHFRLAELALERAQQQHRPRRRRRIH